jgi:hypothetical protein
MVWLRGPNEWSELVQMVRMRGPIDSSDVTIASDVAKLVKVLKAKKIGVD